MAINNKLFNFTLLCTLTLLVFFNSAVCFARDRHEEEEKRFTEAGELNPEQLNAATNRTYDEAITIKEIQISGNALVSEEIILNNLNAKPGVRFDRNVIKNDLRNIYNMGYFTERIKAVPKADSSGITLYIEVEENVPVTGFNVVGNEAIESEQIIKALEDQVGLPQNIGQLNNSIRKIENLYTEKGYILARVKKVQDDPDGVINVDINEGVIDEVELSGNFKTKDFVIERHLTVQPNETYNELKLKKDLARLFGTQAFSDVRRVISPSENDPSRYKLTIEVDEKRTGSVSIGGGVDTETGFFGQAGYFDNNFLGRGQEISLNGLMGSGNLLENNGVLDESPLQIELKFIEPRLFRTLNSLEVVGFLHDMASFQVPLGLERRFGGRVQLARPLKKIPNLAGSVSVGFEDVALKEGDKDEIERLFNEKNINIAERAKQLEAGIFITVGPSLVYDTRNRLINPTDGWYASSNFKEYFAISGGAETFGKASATIRKFFPIGKNSTITIGSKIGTNLIGKVPEFATFRLGGPYTIRGFREGDVGSGEAFVMGSVEYRTPIPFITKVLNYKLVRDLRLAFFFDAGTLFEETITNNLYNYPGYGVSFGSGIIVPLPYLGPIRFDYGYPITSVGAGNKRGRFTFGIGERY